MRISKVEKNLIKSLLGKDLIEIVESNNDVFIYTRATSIIKVISILCASSELGFNALIDSFAIDMLKYRGKFDIYYHLQNKKNGMRLFVVTSIDDGETIPSLTIAFENIAWYEREMFDMFGIMFGGHPDLRRILNSHEHNKFSLRKDCSLV